MSEPATELLQTQVRLARLLERDAKYFEAEELLRSIWDEPMSADMRYEAGRTFARVLRLRNKWTELDELLATLIAQASEAEETESLAQLLVLRMEAELCAYPNDPAKCIDTADLLMTISQDDDLVLRALGHKGLAHLALGHLDEARAALDDCLASAERSGAPERLFLALHFVSQMQIATLDLAPAIAIGHRLIGISEEYAIAREELFHMRDLARAELLAGSAEASAGHLGAYLLANDREYERHRALAYAALLVAEAVRLTAAPTTRRFLEELAPVVAADAQLAAFVKDSLVALEASTEITPAMFVDDAAAVEASTRIFCFNSDVLEELRAAARRAAAPTAKTKAKKPAPAAARPLLIVDVHHALDYFADSFEPLGDGSGMPAATLAALRGLADDYDIRITRKTD